MKNKSIITLGLVAFSVALTGCFGSKSAISAVLTVTESFLSAPSAVFSVKNGTEPNRRALVNITNLLFIQFNFSVMEAISVP